MKRHDADGTKHTRRNRSIRHHDFLFLFSIFYLFQSLRQSVFLTSSYRIKLQKCLELSLNLEAYEAENKIMNRLGVCTLTGNPPQYGVCEVLILP